MHVVKHFQCKCIIFTIMKFLCAVIWGFVDFPRGVLCWLTNIRFEVDFFSDVPCALWLVVASSGTSYFDILLKQRALVSTVESGVTWQPCRAYRNVSESPERWKQLVVLLNDFLLWAQRPSGHRRCHSYSSVQQNNHHSLCSCPSVWGKHTHGYLTTSSVSKNVCRWLRDGFWSEWSSLTQRASWHLKAAVYYSVLVWLWICGLRRLYVSMVATLKDWKT